MIATILFVSNMPLSFSMNRIPDFANWITNSTNNSNTVAEAKSSCKFQGRVIPSEYCSHSVFRKYYTTMGRWPECGTWLDTRAAGVSHGYVLDFCQFKPYNLKECSTRNRLHHIFMMGDSTGWNVFEGLLEIAKKAWSGACERVKYEGLENSTPHSYLPSVDYFSLGNESLRSALKAVNRGCHTCAAVVYDCHMETKKRQSYDLRLEFAAGYKFQDPSLTIPDTSTKWPPSKTFQEFLFKTYLPIAGMPDAIVIVMPLAHEKKNDTLTVADAKKLVELMVKYIPRSTRIFWITDAHEIATKTKTNPPKWVTYGKDRLLATEKIYQLNSQIFNVLKRYLVDSSYNMYGFVNLVNMSSTKLDWHRDIIHYKPVWDFNVMNAFLSTFCAD